MIERGLTLIQPMAAAIVFDHPRWKDVENRPTNLPRNMRGVETTIAIHAGLKWDDGYGLFVHDQFELVWPPHAEAFGAIVGVATLTGRVFTSSMEANRAGRGRWYAGPFGYEIKSARALPQPIKRRGSLGFWRLTKAEQHDIVEQLDLVAA